MSNWLDILKHAETFLKLLGQIALKYNNRVDVRGHNYVFGATQNHFLYQSITLKPF